MINYEEYGIEIIKQSIGEGGSAVVHEGKTITEDIFGLEIGTKLAVKEFKASLLEVENQRERIKQEAKLGSSIKHERLAESYELIETGSGEFALVMEYVDGDDLSKWSQKQRKDTSWARWQQVAIDICDGVAALHSRGVLHRDIKPENVFIVSGRAKVMDIGIACFADPNEHTMHTQLKDFIGSIRYASPQFIAGDSYNEKDDIYMIGVTLLEMLTGKRPYHEIERKVIIPIHMQAAPPKIGKLKEKVPAQITILLKGCLNRNRDRRPDLGALKEALQDPEKSKYIQQEVSRQSSDEKGYPILKITKGGGGFYADMGGDDFDPYASYIVVRRDVGMKVPSLGVQVEPEMWIADVDLRHHKQNVGHFKLIGKRWQEGQGSIASKIASFSGSGRWVDFDKKDEMVQVGDIVVAKSEDG